MSDSDEKLVPVEVPVMWGAKAQKGDVPTMEHPFYRLSARGPKTLDIKYGDVEIQLNSDKPLPTVQDQEIMIFAISMIVKAKNEGHKWNRRVAFKFSDFAKFVGTRSKNVKSRVTNALERLRRLEIKTNVRVGGKLDAVDSAGLVDRYSLTELRAEDGSSMAVVELSSWIMQAIEENHILTLHDRFFELSPNDRRLYQIARKHLGQQSQWVIGVDLLQKKHGFSAQERFFKRDVLRPLNGVEGGLLDINLHFDESRDHVTFTPVRDDKPLGKIDMVILSPDTFEQARTLAQGWDVYHIEQEWRNWIGVSGKDFPRDPDKAFLGFVKTFVAEQSGRLI